MARIFRRLAQLLDVDVESTPPVDGDRLIYDDADGLWKPGTPASGSGAPDDATYLVATAHSDLSAEIPVGATPGGELGGTWASPTVDATHSGSSHASVQAAAEATAAGALSAHASDTTGVHGITDTSDLILEGDSRLTDSRTPSGSAGGVLGGTYPNPSFAADMATQAELDAHESDTTSVHGITNTANLYAAGGTDVALADGGTGASLTDPGADRIVFWDDSDGAVEWLEVGTGLGITGNTLAATGGSGGLHDAYAMLRDEKSANTTGGAANTSAWTKHDLATESFDPDGIVSVSSSVFTLAAGSYYLTGWAACYQTNRFKIKIRDTTNSADLIIGSSVYATGSGGNDNNFSQFSGRITLAGSTNLELQYRAESSADTRALGVESNFGVVEVYAQVEIWREA